MKKIDIKKEFEKYSTAMRYDEHDKEALLDIELSFIASAACSLAFVDSALKEAKTTKEFIEVIKNTKKDILKTIQEMKQSGEYV